jgi:para-aminobenzoate synthetase component 1
MSFELANQLGKKGIPFLIIVNFNKTEVITLPLSELEKENIQFEINGKKKPRRLIYFTKKPVSKYSYEQKFNQVIHAIKQGYTYILNLTQPTEIEINSTLEEIYYYANAKYKIKFKEQFVSYSPETFIKINNNNIISTFPMKGTIDASIKNAEKKLLENQKENAEHIMVTDLLRNDLNMISKKVRVKKFKYLDKIESGNKHLLQMSSEIIGQLENNWQENIGTILDTILPAGSITGTPKKSTVKLINEIENYQRGFFTGIFGVFENNQFDSGVMIRYIEQTADKKFIYKSGGGITLDSDLDSEYNEMIEKIYIF